MSSSSNRQQPSAGRRVGSRLLLALYVFEASAVVAVLAFNRYYNLLDTLAVRQLAMVATPLVLALVSGAYVVNLVRAASSDRRSVTFAIALNLVAVLLVCVGSEVVIRAFSVSELTGTWFGNTLLLPRDWEDVTARHRELLALVRDDLSYFVVDDRLGWVPGRSRRSKEGLYSTSTEGVRSASPGVSYASRPPGPRIAIVGDSFTFGLEVPFESSWGAVLERSLGANVTVLNLGVDGYGVDQAVLRYERDARPWKPDVAILGFIDHDLLRTLSVYPFVRFPDWGFPFSKPRYVLENGELRLLNARLESPAKILSTPSITDLPHIDVDGGWDPDEWVHHTYDASYTVRFLRSRFRRWPTTGSDPHALEMERLNAALITRFTSMATANGTLPLVVYFPSRVDFSVEDVSSREVALKTLDHAGVPYTDLRSCVAAVGVSEAFVPGRPHYSPTGNAAVAACLLPVVRQALARTHVLLLTGDSTGRR